MAGADAAVMGSIPAEPLVVLPVVAVVCLMAATPHSLALIRLQVVVVLQVLGRLRTAPGHLVADRSAVPARLLVPVVLVVQQALPTRHFWP